MEAVRKRAYVILDGTVLPIDRIAATGRTTPGRRGTMG